MSTFADNALNSEDGTSSRVHALGSEDGPSSRVQGLLDPSAPGAVDRAGRPPPLSVRPDMFLNTLPMDPRSLYPLATCEVLQISVQEPLSASMLWESLTIFAIVNAKCVVEEQTSK